MAGLLRALVDLVVPSACAGCGATRVELTFEVCQSCVREVQALEAGLTRPDPCPVGLPPVYALGEYEGVLGELILEFKDRGRHRLAGPLSALLAEAIVAAAERQKPIVVMYIPDTPKAARERYGDHMRTLVELAGQRIRRSGREVSVSRGLVAMPRTADSAEMTHEQRAQAARGRFAARVSGNGMRERSLVLADDIVTTGATLAAATQVLAEEGIQVFGCATIAATRRRFAS